MLKIYSLKTIGKKHVLPVEMPGGNRYIEFKKTLQGDRLAYFQTGDRKLQAAVERSPFFERGDIEVFFEEEEKGKSRKEAGAAASGGKGGKAAGGLKEFPEVRTFAEAREVLGGAPYNIDPMSVEINSAEKMLAKACELGVSFPNLGVNG